MRPARSPIQFLRKADSFEELKAMVHDAVSCHVTTEDRPHLIRLHLVKEELMAV